MNFLAPLYIAGLAGLALPIVFHLIRRSPQGKHVFSSLMFLAPSPPRITRRSRLEHWLLLLLRAAAFALLALAFARPFLRSQATLDFASIRGRRVALLIDSSASMRRPDTWRSAQQEAERVLQQLEPADRVGLIAFDEQPKLLVGWEGDSRPNAAQAALAQTRQALGELAPGWKGTDLGAALVFASDALVEANDRWQSDAAMQVIVISDMQQGARVAALQSYDWPPNVHVQFHPARPAQAGNATLRVAETEASDEQAAEPASEAISEASSAAATESPPGAATAGRARLEPAPRADARFRLRIANTGDARQEQFRVSWADAGGPVADSVSVQAPAGETRVVGLPAPPLGADRVILEGDGSDFDNTFYFSPRQRSRLQVAFWMDDESDDVEQLRMYVEAALSNHPDRDTSFLAHGPDETPTLDDLQDVRLIVARDEIPAARRDVARQFVERGGVLLLVLAGKAGPPMQESLAALLAEPDLQVAEVEPAPFVTLSEIDYRHPVFARLASPQYSDFTQVRFWGHRRLTGLGESARVAARFDNGDLAVVAYQFGQGDLLVMAAGWRPDESQLARNAAKFIPVMEGVAALTARDQWSPPAAVVGQPTPLPPLEQGQWRIDSGAGSAKIEQDKLIAAEPGAYALVAGERRITVAVNLNADESETTPRLSDDLEPMGLAVGRQATQSEEFDRSRHMLDVELEGRQKVWRWLLAAALLFVIAETWLAGRTARRILPTGT